MRRALLAVGGLIVGVTATARGWPLWLAAAIILALAVIVIPLISAFVSSVRERRR